MVCLAVCAPSPGIIKEVAITRMLAGHPCTVQLHAVYEDEQAFHLVSCLSEPHCHRQSTTHHQAVVPAALPIADVSVV